MHKQIFVNLPIKNVERTRAFFAGLGFSFNPQYSNDQALCMQIGENIFAMLLAEGFFKTVMAQILDAQQDVPTPA